MGSTEDDRQVKEAPLDSRSPNGSRGSKTNSLSIEYHAVVVAFRRQPLLPLDDRLYVLQARNPHLTRSARHRCL